jgi:hypothetical protein
MQTTAWRTRLPFCGSLFGRVTVVDDMFGQGVFSHDADQGNP